MNLQGLGIIEVSTAAESHPFAPTPTSSFVAFERESKAPANDTCYIYPTAPA